MNLRQISNPSSSFSPELIPQDMRQGPLTDTRPATRTSVLDGALPGETQPVPLRDIAVEDLSVSLLRTPREIARMTQLRQQINLGVAASVDPHFSEHEKKEMN